MRGVQEATTTPVKCLSLMAWMMPSWPGSEQAYMVSVAYTTSGNSREALATAAVSTVPSMLLPQWQMKTPIRMAYAPFAWVSAPERALLRTGLGSMHSLSKPSSASGILRATPMSWVK
ncbi:hypothetical protein DSECCO2_594440 [anaerobic digester metagenome]